MRYYCDVTRPQASPATRFSPSKTPASPGHVDQWLPPLGWRHGILRGKRGLGTSRHRESGAETVIDASPHPPQRYPEVCVPTLGSYTTTDPCNASPGLFRPMSLPLYSTLVGPDSWGKKEFWGKYRLFRVNVGGHGNGVAEGGLPCKWAGASLHRGASSRWRCQLKAERHVGVI